MIIFHISHLSIYVFTRGDYIFLAQRTNLYSAQKPLISRLILSLVIKIAINIYGNVLNK